MTGRGDGEYTKGIRDGGDPSLPESPPPGRGVVESVSFRTLDPLPVGDVGTVAPYPFSLPKPQSVEGQHDTLGSFSELERLGKEVDISPLSLMDGIPSYTPNTL